MDQSKYIRRMENENRIKPSEAADLAEIKYQTLMNWIRDGKLGDIVEQETAGIIGIRYWIDKDRFLDFLAKLKE